MHINDRILGLGNLRHRNLVDGFRWVVLLEKYLLGCMQLILCGCLPADSILGTGLQGITKGQA